jgi:hypothetical protein
MLIQKLKAKSGEVAVIAAPDEILKTFKSLKPQTAIPARAKASFDFVLLFATQSRELEAAWKKIVPALKEDAVFWVAYPKKTSGIPTDLAGMATGWTVYKGSPWQPVSSVAIDEKWTAIRFRHAPGLEAQRQERPSENVTDADGTVVVDRVNRELHPPKDFAALLGRHPGARASFDSLSFTHRKEYVVWIVEAKKAETRNARLESAIEKLASGKKNPAEK